MGTGKHGVRQGLDTRPTFDLGPQPTEWGPTVSVCRGRFGSGANMAFTAAFLDEYSGGFDRALGAALGHLAAATISLPSMTSWPMVTSSSTSRRQSCSHRHPRDMVHLRRQAVGYGAGLTAYLTRVVVERPSTFPAIARHSARRGPARPRPTRPLGDPAADGLSPELVSL